MLRLIFIFLSFTILLKAADEYKGWCEYDNDNCILHWAIAKAKLDFQNQPKSLFNIWKKNKLEFNKDFTISNAYVGNFFIYSEIPEGYPNSIMVKVEHPNLNKTFSKRYKRSYFVNKTYPSYVSTSEQKIQLNTAKSKLNIILMASGQLLFDDVTDKLLGEENKELLVTINGLDEESPQSYFELMSSAAKVVGKNNPITGLISTQFDIGVQILDAWGSILNRHIGAIMMTGDQTSTYALLIPNNLSIVSVNGIYEIVNGIPQLQGCENPQITYSTDTSWAIATKLKAEFTCSTILDGSGSTITYIDMSVRKNSSSNALKLLVPLRTKDYDSNANKFKFDLTN